MNEKTQVQTKLDSVLQLWKIFILQQSLKLTLTARTWKRMVGIYTRFLLGPGLFSVANLLLVLGSVFILIFILGFHSSGLSISPTWIFAEIFSQGIVGCTPTNVPRHGKSLYFRPISTMIDHGSTRTLGVHLIVPWFRGIFRNHKNYPNCWAQNTRNASGSSIHQDKAEGFWRRFCRSERFFGCEGFVLPFFLKRTWSCFIIFSGRNGWINELKYYLMIIFLGEVCGYVLNDSNFQTLFLGEGFGSLTIHHQFGEMTSKKTWKKRR